jgi:hypothetical protein
MNESEIEDLKPTHYSLTLPKKLKERLDAHLEILKKLDPPQSKRYYWIIEALKDKLDREENKTDIRQKKHLTVHLDEETLHQIDTRIKSTQMTFYAKKNWIIEAIEEKIKIEKSCSQDNQRTTKKNTACNRKTSSFLVKK